MSINTPMTSGIRDNYKRGTAGEFLKQKMCPNSELRIVSAYFTIYAYEALQSELDAIHSLKFLFGEPRFVRSLDPERIERKSFVIEEDGLKLQNQLHQKKIARECAEWMRKKVEIRSIKQANLLHGKMYHLTHNGVEEAITGSSNFTMRGLGLGHSGNNIELNLEVDSNRDRRDLKHWFEELWNDANLVQDVKDDVLLYLAQLYQNHDPEFIYYKTLFHLFEEFLTDQQAGGLLDDRIQLVDSQIWKTLFEFQKDGVKGAIHKILKHNGCILADSVGLGKTYEALAVIKYFELKNDKVLVLCPKKLRENWTIYQAQNNSKLNPFIKDRFSYTVLSHTDLSRESGKSGDINLSTVNWGNYDLVVIDESHNFRNNAPGKRDEEGNIVRKSRYARLMEDIVKSGVKTRELLLSATPVNNDLTDLRNQVYFITEDDDRAFKTSLGIASIRDTLGAAQRTFNEWAKKDGPRRTSELLDRLSSAFFKILDELTIARSRQHIQKYYRDTIAELGGFPKRIKPVSEYPDIDLSGKFMSYDRLNEEISNYQLSLFNPTQYVLPEYRTTYEKQGALNFTQQDRENYLIGMMKVNFLKRLESSVHSFAITMERTVNKIEDLQNRIERFKKFRAENPSLDFDDLEIEDIEDEDLANALQVGEKLVFQMAHLDIDRWLKDLRKDREQLHLLYLAARDVTRERDGKLAKLKTLIAQKVQHPTTDKNGNPNRKVLIFTAFADTAEYLYNALKNWALDDLGIHIAMVSGGSAANKTTFGQHDFNHILTHFSPIAKKRAQMDFMPQESEIDLLIATDCISEGQNLQDCDHLINYDIHWNPVRIIQRFGRIDRIGSINHAVQLVNFWPTRDLEKYIALKNRVEARMALVDIAATQEDNLLKNDLEDLISEDLKYRDKQLLRLREEVLDLEEFNENVALNEFTLDDFRMDLSRYIESNREKLQNAPLGLYAVVPPEKTSDIIQPGVIFCFRQKQAAGERETVNPLQPYFLIYVRESGDIRYSFVHAKQILDLYRTVCVGQSSPNETLCNLFDARTQNGSDMRFYNDLLEKAITSISGTFTRRTMAALFTRRDAKLPQKSEQAQTASDFELITWLVILSPEK